MWSLSDIANASRDLAVIGGILSGCAAIAYKWIIRPSQMFRKEVLSAVVVLKRLEQDVATMSASLGPNGGKSLSDLIHWTSARLNLMVDSLPWSTWEADMDGNYTKVNATYERTFGYSLAELHGNGWKILLHPDDADRFVAHWQQVVHDVRLFRIENVRFVAKNGDVKVVDIQASPALLGDKSYLWMGSLRLRKKVTT